MTRPRDTIERWVIERQRILHRWSWQAEFVDEYKARAHLAFMRKLVPDAAFRLAHLLTARTVIDPEEPS